MKKILVTGGAGYIGSVLVPELLNKGYEVTVYDNLSFGGNSLFPCFINPNFKFVKGDVRDIDLLKKHMVGMDVIIHLAAIVGYPACEKDPQLAIDVNLKATIEIAKNVDKNQYVLFGSTGSNYGAVKLNCGSTSRKLSVIEEVAVRKRCDITSQSLIIL